MIRCCGKVVSRRFSVTMGRVEYLNRVYPSGTAKKYPIRVQIRILAYAICGRDPNGNFTLYQLFVISAAIEETKNINGLLIFRWAINQDVIIDNSFSIAETLEPRIPADFIQQRKTPQLLIAGFDLFQQVSSSRRIGKPPGNIAQGLVQIIVRRFGDNQFIGHTFPAIPS